MQAVFAGRYEHCLGGACLRRHQSVDPHSTIKMTSLMPARMRRYSRVTAQLLEVWALLLLLFAASTAHAQSGAGVLTGTVTDAQEHKPVADVVVTVTSPALQGEQIVVTDNTGFYRIPNLPAGEGYTIRMDKEGFRPFARGGIALRAESTLRANADLLPESLKAEEVVVVAQAPTVDVGSSSTGAAINKDFTRRVPLAAPGGKGSASRSFEAVAAATPGASEDRMGVSISGASSPENAYVIDGLSVNNPGIGTIGSPLSSEFVDEVNVISAGYLPEFGRSTGGTVSATTKSGSDEFHGGVFGYYSPGAFEGTRKAIRQDVGSVAFDTKLNHVADIGADLGGPIIKKKLWFYVGVDLSHESYGYSRYYRALNAPGGSYSKINGTDASWDAVATQFQGIGKLTWAVNEDNKITLSANMIPTSSGGRNQFAVDPIAGGPEGVAVYGQHDAVAHKLLGSAYDASLKWSTAFDNKRVLVDTAVGWHHEKDGTLPSDGSLPGGGGLAAVNQVTWNANAPFHPLTDFDNSAAVAAACGPGGSLCPVTSYVTGGPGDIDVQIFNRYVASSTLTYLFQGAGHHVVKAGAQLELVSFDHLTGHSGGAREAEPAGGGTVDVNEGFGQLVGPDNIKVLDPLHITSKSINVGGFVQDSWSILDKVTLNAGVRYDVQQLYGGNGNVGLSLPNQWAPRVGVIWDPTQEGHAKLFANYARYYQNVPLALNDLTLTGHPVLGTSYDQGGCMISGTHVANCPASAAVAGNSGSSISQKYYTYGNGSSPIDPEIKATSSDEIVFGGEYEILKDARLGLTYTKRWLNRWIEDFSFDNLNTYQLGNPGYGIGSALPKAQRNYDAVTLFFQKAWRDDWLAQASYTVSYLRGNVGGFIAQDGTIGPSHNSDFDSRYFTNNQYGPLPGDHTHDIKIFGAKDWTVAPHHSVSTGASLRAQSGGPINFYASDQIYGAALNLLAPRGSGGRLPWEYNADFNIAYHYNIDKNQTLTFSMDVFNLFNFQAANAVDESYTPAFALGKPGGNLRQARTQDTGRALYAGDVNPNYKNPTSYQPPRSFRFGIRSTF